MTLLLRSNSRSICNKKSPTITISTFLKQLFLSFYILLMPSTEMNKIIVVLNVVLLLREYWNLEECSIGSTGGIRIGLSFVFFIFKIMLRACNNQPTEQARTNFNYFYWNGQGNNNGYEQPNPICFYSFTFSE